MSCSYRRHDGWLNLITGSYPMPMLRAPTWSCRRLEVLDLLDLSPPDERRVGPSTKGRAVGPDVEEVASVDDPGDLGPRFAVQPG